MTEFEGPYALTPYKKLLALFEQESYYTHIDGSASALICRETKKELLKRLANAS